MAPALTGRKEQGQHAHADQVGAVDALVRFGDDRCDAQQRRALGGPITAAAGAVIPACQHDGRDPLGLVSLRGFKDRHPAIVREIPGETAFDIAQQGVAQPDVGEGRAGHHMMIAAPGDIAVEILLCYALLLQITACRRVDRDLAAGRDMVGRQRVAEGCQHAGIAEAAGLAGCAVLCGGKEGRLDQIARLRIPGEAWAASGSDSSPGFSGRIEFQGRPREAGGVVRMNHGGLQLLRIGHQLLHIDRDAILVEA